MTMIPSKVVVTSPDPHGVEALRADLEAVGIQVLGTADERNLVRECIRQAPEALVWWEDWPEDRSIEALRLLAEAYPLPVVFYTLDASLERLEAATQAGAHGYVVNGYSAARLRADLAAAAARFRKERALAEQLEDLSRRHEERKLVDRAKGLLMRSTQMSEDEAFRWLRTISMREHRRVGQVSRQLIEAAHHAQAVNRAGQLRMLSQRCVLLRALAVALPGHDERHAALARSMERADQLLAELRRATAAAPFGDLLEAASQAWGRLRAGLQEADELSELDHAAEQLLVAAERLTSCLEAASPARRLHLINICGRQRMLSQRYAKQLALGALLGASASGLAEAAASTRIEFEQAVGYLQDAPISSGDIRELLAQAERAWQKLLAAGGQRPPPWAAVAEASDVLLDSFDRLTHRYEQGVQALIA